jgi:hypothetical protein
MTDTDTDTADDAEGVASETPPLEGRPDLESDPEPTTDEDADTFPREVVERLRQENGKYRQRAQQAEGYAQRLHTELVKATGRLADPTDLDFDESHLDDPDALAAAVDDLLARKPHLASRKPVGDIGQGQRGGASEPFSLPQMLKERT